MVTRRSFVSCSGVRRRTSESDHPEILVAVLRPRLATLLEVRMSAAVMESGPPHAGSNKELEKEMGEKTDQTDHQLGDLVQTMESVKLTENLDPEKIIKHPLQNAWTLWFFKNDKSKTWEENQRPIITVTTVEDFWSLYNHIEAPSRLPPGSDYSIFKEGIFPDWEDPRNQPGGRWIVNVEKRQRAELLDTYWLEIIFFLIGEHADQHANQVIQMKEL